MAVRICVSSSISILRPVVASSNKYINNKSGFKGEQFLNSANLVRYRSFSTNANKAESNNSERWIIHSKYSDVEIPDVSLTEFLRESQEKYSKLTALIDAESGRSITFGEQHELSIRLASALSRRGITKGDVVALIAPNCIEFSISVLGIANAGATVTTVNPASTSDEIRVQLIISNTCAVVCHVDEVRKILEACKGLEVVRHIIIIGSNEEAKGTTSFQELLRDDGKGLPCNLQINPSEDAVAMPYSSGTTGLPKGVVLTHRNIVANMCQMFHPDVCIFNSTADGLQESLLVVLPFYHIYGFSILLLCPIYSGMKGVLLKKFEQKSYVDTLRKYPFTVLPTVPPLLNFLATSSLVKPEYLSSCRITVCGAAPIGKTLLKQFSDKFPHIAFSEGYGMSEASPLTHVSERGNLVLGSCGPAVPNTSTKIIDLESGKILGPNEGEGELCIKGPQVMKGYLNNEEANRKTLVDGWLHTGDIAKMDENFNIFIVDRLKELIKVKGLQVAPAELEDLLRLHPSVEDVAVIGVPDERAGELPKAFVVLAEGCVEDPDDIKSFVEQRVSSYKRLAGGIEFIKEVPKSAAGKILRKNLK